MSNTPTNAEAWDLWLESITGGHHPASLAKFARAVLAKWAAPQQGAQEPVATLHCNDIGYVWARATEAGQRMRFEQPLNLYTAPAPSAAPLSERDAFEAAWEKLHGKRPVLWSRMFAEHEMETPAHSEVNYFAAAEQAAWKLWQARAALAAQGGKA